MAASAAAGSSDMILFITFIYDMPKKQREREKKTDDEEEADESSECFVFMYIWL